MASEMLVLVSLASLVFFQESYVVNGQFNYKDALSKSILFLEAQQSGKLLPNHRVKWRGDSGLTDGSLGKVDLVGGYYDAGDNVKYGLPMAFTITTLAWAADYFKKDIAAAGEVTNVRGAIRWGTDYLLKATSTPDQLWVQVGDPKADHNCWERPEDMDTPRTLYKIDKQTPGTEIAAETAAALAASSIVFVHVDPTYSKLLLARAVSIFSFGDKYRGTYTGECPFYCSNSGYTDELLWAASWLYKATKNPFYSSYIHNLSSMNIVTEFSWDNKNAGAQVHLTSLGESQFSQYKRYAEQFICSVLPANPFHAVHITPGGLMYVRSGANTQYVTSASLLLTIYSDILLSRRQTFSCGDKVITAGDLMSFVKQQVDYLLGKNPLGMSYMVGYGHKYPTQAHHRGASIVSIKESPQKVSCGKGFTEWFHRNAPNPNLLTGAVVGGPDQKDGFVDRREDSDKLEPTTYTNSAMVGVLARLSTMRSA